MMKREMKTLRQEWNQQHKELRDLLKVPADFARAKRVFKDHHSQMHAKILRLETNFSFRDEILSGLKEAHLRTRLSDSAHSPVWILWHISRVEDACLNGLLAGWQQVFFSGCWQSRIRSPFVGTGNTFTQAMTDEFSEKVDINNLLDYRLAVGMQTQAIIEMLSFEILKEKPPVDRIVELVRNGTVQAGAEFLQRYWGGKPAVNLLLMPATRHPFVHLNEIQVMRPKLLRLL